MRGFGYSWGMIIGIDASRAVTAERTGTEAYAYFLIAHLLPLAAEAGHGVRLYFNEPPAAGLFAEYDHVDQVVIPFRRVWTHSRLAWELHRRPPDVFFTPAHVIPVSYQGASVATVHDLGYHYFPEAHTKQQVAYLKWSTRHNARRGRLVLADSEATKRDLERFYGIAAEKIEVVYPGRDEGLRPEGPPPLTEPYLLYLSTIQPRKNLVRLVEAFAQVAEQMPHRLVLGGRLGWRAEPILQRIEELPAAVRERITLAGYIPEADKGRWISGATALLYPSLYEGFGFPLLEGNGCGTAVIASRSSSLPELAGDGAALLVEAEDTAGLGEAIVQMVQDEGLRERLVARGFENVKRFSWERAARDVLAVLERAAESSW